MQRQKIIIIKGIKSISSVTTQSLSRSRSVDKPCLNSVSRGSPLVNTSGGYIDLVVDLGAGMWDKGFLTV